MYNENLKIGVLSLINIDDWSDDCGSIERQSLFIKVEYVQGQRRSLQMLSRRYKEKIFADEGQ